MTHSLNKGKAGERELAAELSRLFGCHARRGVQYSGGPGSPDVVTDFPRLHIECKRSERLNPYAALDQAIRDAGGRKIPIVMHRRNRRPWVAIVRLDDLPELSRILIGENPCPDSSTPNASEPTSGPRPESP